MSHDCTAILGFKWALNSGLVHGSVSCHGWQDNGQTQAPDMSPSLFTEPLPQSSCWWVQLFSICHIHPQNAHSSEKLLLPPPALEGPTLWVWHHGFSPVGEKQCHRNCLETERMRHACSYIWGRKLATLSQISPLTSMSGPFGLLSVLKK